MDKGGKRSDPAHIGVLAESMFAHSQASHEKSSSDKHTIMRIKDVTMM